MQSAKKAVDKIECLQALYDYDVLNIEAEKLFDDLTKLAQEQLFALVFMDSHLPGINNEKAAQLIAQQQPKLALVPLSADVLVYDQDSLQDHVCHEYLTKPIEKHPLFGVLNQLCGSNDLEH
jgi:CheY-like chemotaxis protein